MKFRSHLIVGCIFLMSVAASNANLDNVALNNFTSESESHKAAAASAENIVSLAASSSKYIGRRGQKFGASYELEGASGSESSDYMQWAKYHKESGRLDSLLGKCYQCIRDRKFLEETPRKGQKPDLKKKR